MKLPRRRFLLLATTAATLSWTASVVRAQSYPTRPVRLMVGFAAGQAIDVLARLVGQSLSDRLGQQFIVENRPGAGGNLVTEAVVRAPPDGYTLLVIGANNAINATLYENLSFNFLRDIVPIAGIYRVPQVMEVNPAFPARTVAEFIAHAKANTGRINFASAGVGSVAHVTGELFNIMAGLNMQHVPYRGAPLALTDLIAGQVDVMFDNIPSSIEHIRAGRLLPLGVSTTTRLPLLPEVPSISEFVPGFETGAFAGLGGPKGTPSQIIEVLNREITAGLSDPTMMQRIIDLGGIPFPASPTDFAKFVAQETDKWAKVVKFSGARAN